MKMHKDRLTERQRLFCEMYVGPGRHCAALAARLAGYAPGCSHVTGCQLLKQPKIAATVRSLEDVVAQEIGVNRQAVIAQLVAAANLAKEIQVPAAIVSAYRSVAQLCGYFRQVDEKSMKVEAGGDDLGGLNRLSDKELENLIMAGAAHRGIGPASPAGPIVFIHKKFLSHCQAVDSSPTRASGNEQRTRWTNWTAHASCTSDTSTRHPSQSRQQPQWLLQTQSDKFLGHPKPPCARGFDLTVQPGGHPLWMRPTIHANA